MSGTRRRDRLTILFALLTLILVIIAGLGTANYYQFYPALQHVQVSLVAFDWKYFCPTPPTTPALELSTINFTIQNPTGYTGLYLKNFYSTLNITDSTRNTTIPQGGLPNAPAQGPLDQERTIKINVPGFNATTEAAALECQTHNVQFVFLPEFTLGTFLDKVGTIKLEYLCQAQIGSASCQQSAISITTTMACYLCQGILIVASWQQFAASITTSPSIEGSRGG